MEFSIVAARSILSFLFCRHLSHARFFTPSTTIFQRHISDATGRIRKSPNDASDLTCIETFKHMSDLAISAPATTSHDRNLRDTYNPSRLLTVSSIWSAWTSGDPPRTRHPISIVMSWYWPTIYPSSSSLVPRHWTMLRPLPNSSSKRLRLSVFPISCWLIKVAISTTSWSTESRSWWDASTRFPPPTTPKPTDRWSDGMPPCVRNSQRIGTCFCRQLSRPTTAVNMPPLGLLPSNWCSAVRRSPCSTRPNRSCSCLVRRTTLPTSAAIARFSPTPRVTTHASSIRSQPLWSSLQSGRSRFRPYTAASTYQRCGTLQRSLSYYPDRRHSHICRWTSALRWTSPGTLQHDQTDFSSRLTPRSSPFRLRRPHHSSTQLNESHVALLATVLFG